MTAVNIPLDNQNLIPGIGQLKHRWKFSEYYDLGDDREKRYQQAVCSSCHEILVVYDILVKWDERLDTECPEWRKNTYVSWGSGK